MVRQRLFVEWALVGIVACLLAWFATSGAWLAAIDNRIFDAAAPLGAPQADERILIVEIDDASLQQLGRWPWPRHMHTRLLQALARHRPAAIGYDVLFLEPSADDAELAAAMQAAGPVLLPALVDRDSLGRPLGLQTPLDPIANAAAGFGLVELTPDSDGLIRRSEELEAQGPLAPRWSDLILQKIAPSQEAGRQKAAPFLINFAGLGAFRKISFASLAAGEVPPALIRDKLLLVGATAPGIGDIHAVPSTAGGLMPGVEIQANILNTQLAGVAISTPTHLAATAFALIPLALLLAGFLRLPPAANALLAAGLIVGIMAVSVILLAIAHVWLAPSTAIAAIILVHILWGWRRLTVMSRFIAARTSALAAEPGIRFPATRVAVGEDAIAGEAHRLDDVIAQLQGLRAFISGVVEHFPDAICVVGRDGHVTLGNRATQRLFGEAVIGQPIDALCARLSSLHTGDQPIMRDEAGRSYVLARSDLADGFGIVSFPDITELQRAADERDEALQFLSHDIRSPNAAIVAMLESRQMAQARTPAATLADETVRQIQSLARHGLMLADDFVQLARARRRTIDVEPVDLCDVAREAADVVWPRAVARHITFDDQCADGEIWVEGDRSMLVRATINLLENAVKFAPEAAQVRFWVAEADGQAILRVSGPGPAMPPERAENPFVLYARGRSGDGNASMGLGLAFVQTTAQRHDGLAGYVWLDGFGPEFSITLPLSPSHGLD